MMPPRPEAEAKLTVTGCLAAVNTELLYPSRVQIYCRQLPGAAQTRRHGEPPTTHSRFLAGLSENSTKLARARGRPRPRALDPRAARRVLERLIIVGMFSFGLGVEPE